MTQINRTTPDRTINQTTGQLTTADFAGSRQAADRRATPWEFERDNLSENADPAPRETFAEPADFSVTPDAEIRTPKPNTTADTLRATPFFSEVEIGDLRSRWNNIQAEFVDEPRRSVEQADQLVAAAMQRLAEGFANERASLEQQWESGDNVSTEDLRIALQRYRTFFGRLLNAA
jgi:hypothetical protein